MSEERENMEWLNEYPMLKQLSAVNAFKVPANYFEEMEGRIMDEIKLAQLKQAYPQDGFVLPANYFDELTQNINSRIGIDEVLNNGKGFTIPEGYFEQLTGNIESRIAVDELLNKSPGFTVPENYFDQLTGDIESRIAVDELLNSEAGFNIPEGYFEQLTGNIESRLAVEQFADNEKGFIVPEAYFEGLEARIIQNTINVSAPAPTGTAIVRKLWTTTAFKYASAACFSLIVGAAVLTSEFNDTAIHNRSDLHKALSKISKSDMENYLELNGDASTIMENADPNSLTAISTADADDSTTDVLN
ncbi:hypothetical protein BDD43_2500 [Mucilaginibacter gracilis]|uniref:Uncharacterized protein n=1 Tax=Mucilaginibacter gracilis TaxID=423350 RepID=A0A495J1Z8_9SPHI|nr:hypothetical protein [Mucilaginibacter gracilis]RKR82324.1 hypothetical protein BDD43_2500 [Mucilaginibacter gracilis]